MKTLYILLLCCITFISTAQDPDPALFENTWYLEKLEIEGEEIFPPNDYDGMFFIDPNRINIGHPLCSDSLTGTVSSVDDTTFTLKNDITNLIGDCTDAIIFMHYSIYEIDSPQTNPFNYIISTNDGILALLVENTDGNKAYYNNVRVLDIPEVSPTLITLYPNPVQNQLFIHSSTPLEKASIYTVAGCLAKEVSLKDATFIHTEALPQGLYFITLLDEKGDVLTKKFVKQ